MKIKTKNLSQEEKDGLSTVLYNGMVTLTDIVEDPNSKRQELGARFLRWKFGRTLKKINK